MVFLEYIIQVLTAYDTEHCSYSIFSVDRSLKFYIMAVLVEQMG